MKVASIEGGRTESLWSDLAELCKARLSFLVLITTLVGFLLGWRGPMDYLLLAATLVGTALCAAGASALNQWWERDLDAKMRRTQDRPLPGKRLQAWEALWLGLLCSITGIALLLAMVNARAAFLAFTTIAIYVLVYTPLKQMTSLNTLVGAVPGALPPLIGWVAARGSYHLEGCLLFALLWFWQMPHFLAIAWMYREDYSAAGFVMLPGTDADGSATARQAFLYTVCLLLVSLMPALLGFQSGFAFFGSMFLGLGFAVFALRFLAERSHARARALFLASILYLPLVLGLLVATRR